MLCRKLLFAGVDIKEAFYSIPLRVSDRKLFRFMWRGQKYQFTCLVMGLSTSPRVFTKVLKPIFSSLRHKGYVSTIYIDDVCLQGQTYQECQNNVLDTVLLLDRLGFTVHNQKSSLIPSQSITFVGFLLNSTSMTVKLTVEKVDKLISLCHELLGRKSVLLRQLAKLIGKLVASEPGVEFAQLHYKPTRKI